MPVPGKRTQHRTWFLITTFAMACTWTWAANSSSVYARQANQSGTGADSEASKLFASTCAGCHGLDGRGGEKGPNIATRREVVKRSNAETLAILKNGVPNAGMPAFGSLGISKLKSLVTHLRLLQGLDKDVTASGDPARGKELFFRPDGCADCHMLNGQGGFLASDLTLYGAITPLQEMREGMANHDHLPRAQTIAVSTSGGKTFRGFVRNEDNFSLQLQTFDGNFHFLDKSSIAAIGVAPKDPATSAVENKLNGRDLDALVSYLVTVARTSQQATSMKKSSKYPEDEDF